jgi:hypothetical protein
MDHRNDGGSGRLPAGIDLSDFNAIEGAVSETVRGRWFLAEYARRLRAQDTGRILSALGEIEARLGAGGSRGLDAADRIQAQGIAERLADALWGLREHGAPDHLCRQIERETAAIAALGGGPAERGPLLARDVTPALPAEPTQPDPEAVAMTAPQTAPLWTLERIDALTVEEKIRLFA